MSVLTSTPPVTTAAAWRGDRLAETGEWIYRLSPEQVDELETLGRRFIDADPDLRTVSAAEYPLVACADAVALWGRDVDYGRGFVLVRACAPTSIRTRSPPRSITFSACTWAIRSGRTRWAT